MAKKNDPSENENPSPEEKIAALEATIKALEINLEELNIVNNQLSDKIEEQEVLLAKKGDKSAPVAKEKKKATIPTKSFKVGKEEHVFTVPQFTNPLAGHAVITAEEALTNPELLEHLVKNNCGVTKRKGA